tara:strand:+ start:38 stop:1087 length:1050 start_codon:yes stop_codon:yes gene_type:complete
MKKFFFITLIIIFFFKIQNVFSNVSIFTVDNIEVVGKTNNQKYRGEYLDVSFRRGFEQLILGIIRKNDQKELLSTDLKTIKSLISNYRILEEDFFEDEYRLKVSIVFDRYLVGKFLQINNISYSEVKSLDMLLYPILIKNSELEVLSGNEFFLEWNEQNEIKNINFVLPVENLDDLDFIKKNIFQLEEINLSRLVDNYEIKNSTILILRYDKEKLNVFLKSNLEGSLKAKKITYNNKDLDNKNIRQDIIKNLKYYINELWKEENLVDISAPSFLTLNAKINDRNSLKSIIDKIKKINLIQNYKIEELDSKSAKIKIKFFGQIKNLQNSFLENGFEFKILHDEWSIYLTS